MAGDWIKMTIALSTSPKVVRISSASNADGCPQRVRVVGGLHALWCLFDQHSTDGKLAGYTLEMVDEVIGWRGFARAVADVGWIEVTQQGIEIPEFETHNGAPAKRRAMEADRKRRDRKPSALEADKKRTREEKRRVTPIVPETFLQFWTAYPRKEAKAKALEAFKKIVFVNGDFEKLLAALEAAKGSDQWRRDAGKFIPHPATWLNGRRFEDEVAQPAKAVWTP